MRFFLDTEFLERGRFQPVTLISLGIVAEDGAEYYAESNEFNPKATTPWLKENVVPFLTGPRKNVAQIANEVREFCGPDKPEFWGYYCDYDWVVFCQMFGSMTDLPKGWPMYCRDIKQFCDSVGNPKLPKGREGKNEHNALADAQWNRDAWLFLQNPPKLDDQNLSAASEQEEEIAEKAAYAIKDWERDHKRDADKADMVPFILAALQSARSADTKRLETALEHVRKLILWGECCAQRLTGETRAGINWLSIIEARAFYNAAMTSERAETLGGKE